jgi:hypothetical protein
MRAPNFNKNRGPQFSVKDGDNEVTFIKRGDGSVYTQTKAVAPASTVLISCGLGALGFAIYFAGKRQIELSTGVIQLKYGAVLETADPIRFAELLRFDLHVAIVLAVVGTVCVCIGMAKWYANNQHGRR